MAPSSMVQSEFQPKNQQHSSINMVYSWVTDTTTSSNSSSAVPSVGGSQVNNKCSVPPVQQNHQHGLKESNRTLSTATSEVFASSFSDAEEECKSDRGFDSGGHLCHVTNVEGNHFHHLGKAFLGKQQGEKDENGNGQPGTVKTLMTRASTPNASSHGDIKGSAVSNADKELLHGILREYNSSSISNSSRDGPDRAGRFNLFVNGNLGRKVGDESPVATQQKDRSRTVSWGKSNSAVAHKASTAPKKTLDAPSYQPRICLATGVGSKRSEARTTMNSMTSPPLVVPGSQQLRRPAVRNANAGKTGTPTDNGSVPVATTRSCVVGSGLRQSSMRILVTAEKSEDTTNGKKKSKKKWHKRIKGRALVQSFQRNKVSNKKTGFGKNEKKKKRLDAVHEDKAAHPPGRAVFTLPSQGNGKRRSEYDDDTDFSVSGSILDDGAATIKSYRSVQTLHSVETTKLSNVTPHYRSRTDDDTEENYRPNISALVGVSYRKDDGVHVEKYGPSAAFTPPSKVSRKESPTSQLDGKLPSIMRPPLLSTSPDGNEAEDTNSATAQPSSLCKQHSLCINDCSNSTKVEKDYEGAFGGTNVPPRDQDASTVVSLSTEAVPKAQAAFLTRLTGSHKITSAAGSPMNLNDFPSSSTTELPELLTPQKSESENSSNSCRLRRSSQRLGFASSSSSLGDMIDLHGDVSDDVSAAECNSEASGSSTETGTLPASPFMITSLKLPMNILRTTSREKAQLHWTGENENATFQDRAGTSPSAGTSAEEHVKGSHVHWSPLDSINSMKAVEMQEKEVIDGTDATTVTSFSSGAVGIGSRIDNAEESGSIHWSSRHLRSLQSAAEEHLRNGRHDEALIAFEEILAVQVARYGDEPHPRVGTARYNVANALFQAKKFESAVDACKVAVQVRKRCLGDEDLEVAVALSLLGLAHLECERYGPALAAFREALKIRQMSLGRDHPKVAKILNNIGCALFELREIGAARHAFDEALEVQRSIIKAQPGDNQISLSIAATLCNLASISLMQKRFDEALIQLEEALSIQVAALDGDDETVQKTRTSIDNVERAREYNRNRHQKINKHATDSVLPTQEPAPLQRYGTDAFPNIGKGEIHQTKQREWYFSAKKKFRDVLKLSAHYDALDSVPGSPSSSARTSTRDACYKSQAQRHRKKTFEGNIQVATLSSIVQKAPAK